MLPHDLKFSIMPHFTECTIGRIRQGVAEQAALFAPADLPVRQPLLKVRAPKSYFSSLGYRPPAPEAVPWPVPSSGSASLHLLPALAKEVIMH